MPNLVGLRADLAIQRLRELNLLPITLPTEVDDVNEAGVVLGLDPPAGSSVRPRAMITMSIAAHRDFKGHPDSSLPRQADRPVELNSTGATDCDRSANSPAERRDDLGKRQEPAVLPGWLWL